jgi:uncharacterized Zn finger protein (UPF0148 family)
VGVFRKTKGLSCLSMDDQSADAPDPVCPKCGEPLVLRKPFCPNCGFALAPLGNMPEVNAYVEAKVKAELANRLKEQSTLVREIADTAENAVWARFKKYKVIVSVAAFVLAALGIKTCSDVNQRVVDEARSRIEPIVKSTEERAKKAALDIDKTAKGVTVVQKKLDDIDKMATAQRNRIASQSGEVARSERELQIAEDRANKASADFEKRAVGLESRLNQLGTQYQVRYARIEKASGEKAIREAFPGIGEEPYAVFRGERVDKSQKKSGEKWINIMVYPSIIERNLLAAEKLNEMRAELLKAGFTPFIGSFISVGRIAGNTPRLGYSPSPLSHVFYYETGFSRDAESVVAIADKYLPARIAGAELIDPSKLSATSRVVVKTSGLDCQLLIDTN